jgi:ABC-type polysaccharide/polyol phosphate transport system ATPase subunit
MVDVVKRFRYPGIAKQTTLKELFLKTLRGQTQSRRTLKAIAGVSFSIPPGKMFGIVGRNGSGKTTLLRLLAGVYVPDEGRITVKGSLAPLLSLAAGFHPDLTGRENARIELLILGFSAKQIQQRMDQIIEFAEIGKYIDAPLRTYSNGMMMRLAFASAINVDPDVLLLDEVLAVGDAVFAEKCLRCIDDFRARGKTIVLVTHSMEMIRERCDVAMWLDKGKVMAFGDPATVTEAYRESSPREHHEE